MTKIDDNRADDSEEPSSGSDANPAGKNQRHEPQFSSFDDDSEDDYEEPDRDTDYTSVYRAYRVEEEEEFEHAVPAGEVDEPLAAEDAALQHEFEPSVAEEHDNWLEKGGYVEEEEDAGPRWPMSLIAVAVVALGLLVAGGYGVMQQRAATEEELRNLRAALATTANPEEVSASREALQNLQQSYDKLAANAEALTLENRRFADTVAGLEAQLGVQQAVLTKTAPIANQGKPQTPEAIASLYGTKAPPAASQAKPATAGDATSPLPAASEPVASKPAATEQAAPKPITTPAAAATPSGPWFVNFGSYATRAMADTWAARLQPNTGEVIVAPNTRDGKTLYRVRVIGLDSRSSAEKVARALETQLRVSELWVGKE